ncbi:DUF898 family protein [uncultured Sporomusa sp.]|uniref:DUF898 family protein n=1 Tax=uncultured Sporomusa sp. TaxID=307249 RepID=UPI0025871A56|nr:DUF898 family protein [uncultured Sporomusa sp.]
MSKTFEFRGTGFGYLWLVIWTSIVSVITLGLYFPWAYSAQQRWIADNTYVNGRQLLFTGTGIQFLGHWLLIMVLTFITFGLYVPWAYCQLKRWETENTCFADEVATQSGSPTVINH